MERRNLLIIGVAVFLGLLAVFVANSFFAGKQAQQEQLAQQSRSTQIVIASADLPFGTALSAENVRLAPWPADSVPAGAFTSVEDAVKNRVALRAFVAGEPLLASKVSGANGRATLSAKLPTGQLAFAVPISDVAGAGGFVRPGDLVDVLFTHRMSGPGATDADKITDVLLQAVPVLAIDQDFDETKAEPKIGKTATLQVDTYSAQKLALSMQLGTLTLALRNVADQAQGSHRGVTRRDIGGGYVVGPRFAAAPNTSGGQMSLPPVPTGLAAPLRPSGPTMRIVRGTKQSDEELLRGY